MTKLLRFSMAVVLLAAHALASAQSFWGGTEYGMSVDQVKSALPNVTTPSHPNRLSNGAQELLMIENVELAKRRFIARFYFAGGKLTQVMLSLEQGRTFPDAMLVFDALTEAFQEKYGLEMDRDDFRRGTVKRTSATWIAARTNINVLAVSMGENSALLNINYQARAVPSAEVVFERFLPPNQWPMYGGMEKTEEMKRSDAAFFAAIENQGLSRQDAAMRAIQSGWSYWAKRDRATAMARFNQAWLLDPENGNAYHGFALITSERGGAPTEVERFFMLAVSKPRVEPTAFVDYGRFFWTQKNLEKSLVQLNKALQLSSTARNARSQIAFVYYLKGDFGNACNWAQAAQKNKDQLEKGFLEDMCRRGRKS